MWVRRKKLVWGFELSRSISKEMEEGKFASDGTYVRSFIHTGSYKWDGWRR